MTHPIVGSFSLGGLLPCCIIDADSPIWCSLRGLLPCCIIDADSTIWCSLRGLLPCSHFLDDSSYYELRFFGGLLPFLALLGDSPLFVFLFFYYYYYFHVVTMLENLHTMATFYVIRIPHNVHSETGPTSIFGQIQEWNGKYFCVICALLLLYLGYISGPTG